MFRWSCLRGECCKDFRDAIEGPFPEDVGFVALYSKSDGIVNWRACVDPAADELVARPHLALRHERQRPGLPRRRGALQRFRGDDPLLADDLPRRGVCGVGAESGCVAAESHLHRSD